MPVDLHTTGFSVSGFGCSLTLALSPEGAEVSQLSSLCRVSWAAGDKAASQNPRAAFPVPTFRLSPLQGSWRTPGADPLSELKTRHRACPSPGLGSASRTRWALQGPSEQDQPSRRLHLVACLEQCLQHARISLGQGPGGEASRGCSGPQPHLSTPASPQVRPGLPGSGSAPGTPKHPGEKDRKTHQRADSRFHRWGNK